MVRATCTLCLYQWFDDVFIDLHSRLQILEFYHWHLAFGILVVWFVDGAITIGGTYRDISVVASVLFWFVSTGHGTGTTRAAAIIGRKVSWVTRISSSFMSRMGLWQALQRICLLVDTAKAVLVISIAHACVTRLRLIRQLGVWALFLQSIKKRWHGRWSDLIFNYRW